jgi:hypothetical protein
MLEPQLFEVLKTFELTPTAPQRWTSMIQSSQLFQSNSRLLLILIFNFINFL